MQEDLFRRIQELPDDNEEKKLILKLFGCRYVPTAKTRFEMSSPDQKEFFLSMIARILGDAFDAE